ncbi:MAG: hypothetical protein HRT90_05510 [Candidatus Margulisbacteria bacterium]|nr:hypothetical protein [Candidatus Margulisiibacteriota bacterium]
MAFNGHAEIVGIFFLSVAIIVRNGGNIKLSTILLSCACGAKPIAFIFVPFILRLSWKNWLLFFVTLAVIYFPLLYSVQYSEWHTLITFLRHWEYHSTGYLVLSLIFPGYISRCVGAILFLAFFGQLLYRHLKNKENVFKNGHILLFVLLFLSPVANPWYFLWVIPFLPYCKNLGEGLILLMLPLTYIQTDNFLLSIPGQYLHPLWVNIAGIAFFLMTFLVYYFPKLISVCFNKKYDTTST